MTSGIVILQPFETGCSMLFLCYKTSEFFYVVLGSRRGPGAEKLAS